MKYPLSHLEKIEQTFLDSELETFFFLSISAAHQHSRRKIVSFLDSSHNRVMLSMSWHFTYLYQSIIPQWVNTDFFIIPSKTLKCAIWRVEIVWFDECMAMSVSLLKPFESIGLLCQYWTADDFFIFSISNSHFSWAVRNSAHGEKSSVCDFI